MGKSKCIYAQTLFTGEKNDDYAFSQKQEHVVWEMISDI